MARCFTFIAVIMLLANPCITCAQDKITPEKLQQWLKRYPDADANRDGTLSLDEAKNYRQKMIEKRGESRKGSEAGRSDLPAPTHPDVKYGPHENNVLDLWLAKSDTPTPLVVFIHGGGFVGGDKSKAKDVSIKRCLNEGVSFMSINYRFRVHAPIQDILRDTARAIQFVRLNAGKYNIDPKQIASYGGSAGAGSSLWLAVHDDLADSKNPDPVLRQSSRIIAAGCMNSQSTYDMTEWEKLIGEFQPEWLRDDGEDVKFYHFKSRDDFNTPEGKKILEDCSMVGQITKDDPPVIMSCSQPDGEPGSRGHLIHHPRHMHAVKKACEAAGVRMRIAEPGDSESQVLDFLVSELKKSK